MWRNFGSVSARDLVLPLAGFAGKTAECSVTCDDPAYRSPKPLSAMEPADPDPAGEFFWAAFIFCTLYKKAFFTFDGLVDEEGPFLPLRAAEGGFA